MRLAEGEHIYWTVGALEPIEEQIMNLDKLAWLSANVLNALDKASQEACDLNRIGTTE